MSRNPELKNARNEAIRKAYNELSAEMVGNKQKYRYEAILVIIASRFYLSPDTISNIIVKA